MAQPERRKRGLSLILRRCLGNALLWESGAGFGTTSKDDRVGWRNGGLEREVELNSLSECHEGAHCKYFPTGAGDSAFEKYVLVSVFVRWFSQAHVFIEPCSYEHGWAFKCLSGKNTRQADRLRSYDRDCPKSPYSRGCQPSRYLDGLICGLPSRGSPWWIACRCRSFLESVNGNNCHQIDDDPLRDRGSV